jgi:hypothetical protein
MLYLLFFHVLSIDARKSENMTRTLFYLVLIANYLFYCLISYSPLRLITSMILLSALMGFIKNRVLVLSDPTM